jgi:hydrogenase small subunit
MGITRRDFLKYCGASAAVIGLSSLDLRLLEKALASPTAPTVIWLQGSSCTGCSISFIDRISSSAPYTTKEVLTDAVNLTFHPTLMATAGESAVANAKKAYDAGNYILVVEGGVPTLFDGHTCVVWSFGGQEVTMKEAVQQYASKAAAIICVGSCASFGGMSAAPPNVTAVQSVKTATGKSPICVAGCPPHPDWMVYVVAKLLGGQTLAFVPAEK